MPCCNWQGSIVGLCFAAERPTALHLLNVCVLVCFLHLRLRGAPGHLARREPSKTLAWGCVNVPIACFFCIELLRIRSGRSSSKVWMYSSFPQRFGKLLSRWLYPYLHVYTAGAQPWLAWDPEGNSRCSATGTHLDLEADAVRHGGLSTWWLGLLCLLLVGVMVCH